MKSNWFPIVLFAIVCYVIFEKNISSKEPLNIIENDSVWHAPSFLDIPNNSNIYYGKQLIQNTAYYFGPMGKIAHITNGMNCQNCHLDAGTKPWGNNYGAVAANYPLFRARSGSIESIPKRINDCFERSLNGKGLDTNSAEMNALVAYIKWVGKDVAKASKPKGSGIMNIALLDRAADTISGKSVFINRCVKCHGNNGEGQLNLEGYGYVYPPLWGEHSFNNGAGLNRLSRFAGFIKNNMPNPTTNNYKNPELSDEEAWDVAAYIIKQNRPKKDVSKDWPKTATKPFDYAIQPFTDTFSVKQHLLGPFKPIIAYKESMTAKNIP